MKIATEILELAMKLGASVTTAESCTGGMVAAALTDPPGASNIFRRGVVTYSNDAKIAILGVRGETLDTFGAVSEEVAVEMAVGARSRADATFAVAITGIAGPGGSEHKPEGRVCFALASENGVNSETVEFGAQGRAKVRRAARDHALVLLRDALRGAR